MATALTNYMQASNQNHNKLDQGLTDDYKGMIYIYSVTKYKGIYV